MAQYSLGIDIGGTFTDLVVYDHDTGARWSRKVLTTHDDPARAVAAGVAGLLGQARVDPTAFSRTVHATTLFTNALIERKGAVTGLITTAGFAGCSGRFARCGSSSSVRWCSWRCSSST